MRKPAIAVATSFSPVSTPASWRRWCGTPALLAGRVAGRDVGPRPAALVLCLAAATAACGADPIRVDESGSGRAVMLEVDQELIVTLASNPSTGYAWTYELTEEGVLADVGSEYEPVRPVLPGSGGHETFRFVAARSGRTLLRFEYRRPWETDTPPARTASYDVVVQ